MLAPMYAVVRDTPSSWEEYRLPAAELGTDVPDGLLIRVAGRTAEGVRAIEIWRGRDELDRFEREQLSPAQGRVPAPLAPETVRTLAVEHFVQWTNEKEES
jgi:hypothetical protein